MAWAAQPHRRYSTGGAGLPPLPPAPSPAVAAPAQLFPGMHPRYLLSPKPSNGALTVEYPGSTSCPAAGWPGSASPHAMLEPEPPASATVNADEEQLQSMLSALRVALSKKEAALIVVAGQLYDVQGRLQGCEADRRILEAQLRDAMLSAGTVAPGQLAAAASVTPEGRLVAQAREELGREVARAAELAAERDGLAQDVALLQQQLMAAAQAEAKERERLCTEATQSRLLARARARQVEQLQTELQHAAGRTSSASAAAAQQLEAVLAEAASAKASAAEAAARAAGAELLAEQLRLQLENAQETGQQAEARAARAEAELAEAQQQMDWQSLRIAELEQTSSVGQLMRKYEAEVQRLRAQFDAERRDLQQQLAQAQQQQQQQQQQQPPAGPMQHQEKQQQPSLDSAAWAALFDDSCTQQSAAEVQDAGVQTEEQQNHVQPWMDPTLLEAARQEIEHLQDANAALLESQTQAQHTLQDALEQQRQAVLAHQREVAALHAEAADRQLELDAALRTEAALRERLSMAERQLAHQKGEVQALREANEKLELAVAALKEEADAAGQVPQQELEVLQAELQRAVAHTDALEAQVQQLKQAAAAAAQQHDVAVEQQAQQGALEAAAQVAAAVQTAEAQHAQQLQELQAQLAEAQQQLGIAGKEVTTMREADKLRQECRMNQVAQTDCQPCRQHAESQTDAAPGLDAASAPHEQMELALVPSSATQVPWQQQEQHQVLRPTRASTACESPAQSPLRSGSCSPGLSVATTAKQLQLELARVKLSPLRPLANSSSMAAGRHRQQSPSRQGSACGEVGPQALGTRHQADSWDGRAASGSYNMAGLPARLPSPAAAGLGPGSRGSGRLRLAADDEDDACFATPLAHTPTSLSALGEASPFSMSCQLSPGVEVWTGSGLAAAAAAAASAAAAQLQSRLPQAGPPVPALDLQLVRPYTSLSCDSSVHEHWQPAAGSGWDSGRGSLGTQRLAEASTSVSSLSSLGPSASQLGTWAGPSSGGGLLEAAGRGEPAAAAISAKGDGDHNLFTMGSSWHSVSLDASLARLAALTAGLRQR